MLSLPKNALGRLRLLGYAEGVSFLVLLGIAMPLKYLLHMPLAVRVVGMLHGILFLLYVTSVILIKEELNWSFKKTFLVLVTSLIPLGIFYADVKVFREEKK